jgi:hypothetical protein
MMEATRIVSLFCLGAVPRMAPPSSGHDNAAIGLGLERFSERWNISKKAALGIRESEYGVN